MDQNEVDITGIKNKLYLSDSEEKSNKKVQSQFVSFSLQTAETFDREFGKKVEILDTTDISPHYDLDHDAIEFFLKFWIPQVFVGDCVLRSSGGKVKYFPLFSLLGSIAILSDSVVKITTPDTSMDEVDIENAVEELTSKNLLDLSRPVGHEEYIVKGQVEFMIYKSLQTNIIESLVEVKKVVPTASDLMGRFSPVW